MVCFFRHDFQITRTYFYNLFRFLSERRAGLSAIAEPLTQLTVPSEFTVINQLQYITNDQHNIQNSFTIAEVQLYMSINLTVNII